MIRPANCIGNCSSCYARCMARTAPHPDAAQAVVVPTVDTVTPGINVAYPCPEILPEPSADVGKFPVADRLRALIDDCGMQKGKLEAQREMLHRRLETLSAAENSLREAGGGWLSVEEQKPPKQTPVLVAVSRHVCIAEYIPARTVLAADYLDPDGDFDEEHWERDEDGELFVPESWYERAWFEADHSGWLLNAAVTHWMPLPKAPAIHERCGRKKKGDVK